MMRRSRLGLLSAVVSLSIAFPTMAANAPQPLAAIGDVTGFRVKGGRTHWEISRRLTTKLSASQLSTALKVAYEKAHAYQAARQPGTFKVSVLSPVSNTLEYDDGDGNHWKGILTVEPSTSAHGHTYTIRFVTNCTNAHRSGRYTLEPCLPTRYGAGDR